MNNILISIIIPVYNVEDYIMRCLESIAAQKVSDYEVIIIDDKSSDNTLHVIKKAQNMFENIQILEQPHAGQAKARNLGIANARGKYITFIDGDDYWEEGHLLQLYNVLNSTDCDMAIGTKYNVVQGGEKKELQVISNTEIVIGKSEIFFREKRIIGSMWLATCKREMIVKQNIRFTEEYSCNEDFDFILSCVIHAKGVVLLNWSYYNYFRDNVNSTYVNLTGNKIIVYMQVCQKWYDYFMSNYERYSYVENALSGITRHSLWALNQMRELSGRDPDFSKICRYLKQTRYILWPENKTKNMGLYIRKMRIQKCAHVFKQSCKRLLKMGIRCINFSRK